MATAEETPKETSLYFILLDGQEKSLRKIGQKYGIEGKDVHFIARMLPEGESTSAQSAVWWYDAFQLMLDGFLHKDPSDPSYGEPRHLTEAERESLRKPLDKGYCFFWGASQFLDGFLNEVRRWDEKEPVLWSKYAYQRTKTSKHHGFFAFRGSLGILLPRSLPCDFETPKGLGNRFFISHMQQELGRLGISYQFRGDPWPAPREELTRRKGLARVTLAMIAKDEEKFIAGSLEQALPYVDRIVLVDTGSSDLTREIAMAYGAEVLQHPWNDDFASARNAYLNVIKEGFILTLDADEFLTEQSAKNLREAAEQGDKRIHYIRTYNYRGNSKAASTSQANVRLFWRDDGIRYIGKIHEQLVSPREKMLSRAPYVLHYGYLPSVMKSKKKDTRNMSILQEIVGGTPQGQIPPAGEELHSVVGLGSLVDVASGTTSEATDANPFTWFNLGWQHMSLNHPKEALEAFEKYFAIERPDLLKIRPSAFWFASQAALLSGKPQTALEYAEKACESSLPDAFLAKGVALRALGRKREAAEAFRLAASGRKPPDFPYEIFNQTDSSIVLWKARHALGAILEEEGSYEEAEEQYRLAFEKAPYELDVIISLSRIARMQSKFNQALNWAEKGLKQNGERPQIHVEYVLTLAALSRFEEAFQHLENVEGSSGFTAGHRYVACLTLAESALARKAFDACLRACDMAFEAAEAQKEKEKVLLVKASCLREEGSIEECEDLLKSMPENANAQNYLGNLYLSQQRIEDAEASFRTAISLSSSFESEATDLGYRLDLARALILKGKVKAALEWISPYVEPENPQFAAQPDSLRLQASILAGRCLNSLGKFGDALKVLNRGRSPSDFDLSLGDEIKDASLKLEWHLVAGNAYFGLGDLDRAASEYAEAYGVNPDDPELLKRIGLLMMKLQRWEDAENALFGYLKAQPDDKTMLSLYQAVLAMRKASGF